MECVSAGMEGAWTWVGGADSGQEGLRHIPTRNTEAPTKAGLRSKETNTDAPDAVTLSPGETASLTKEPHGPQARQMKIHM